MSTFQVKKGLLKDIANKTVILKGVNVDANKSGFEDIWQLDEIAKTKANAVRIAWWANWKGQVGPFPFNTATLERILLKCQQHRLVAIIEIHDVTCTKNDNADFENVVMNFWLSDEILALIQQFQNRVIINIANEFGKVFWTDNDASALVDYLALYQNAVSRIRAKNIKVPIMIDAPDCGTSADVLLTNGQQMLNFDPLKNIIFSVHTYWSGFSIAKINSQFAAMKASGLCFVLGEIANIQGNDNVNMNNNIDLAASGQLDVIALQAKANKIGFLWWLWWNDGVQPRRLTIDGRLLNLTEQGIRVLTSTKAYSFKKTTITKANF